MYTACLEDEESLLTEDNMLIKKLALLTERFTELSSLMVRTWA
jgi:hypothetical protein